MRRQPIGSALRRSLAQVCDVVPGRASRTIIGHELSQVVTREVRAQSTVLDPPTQGTANERTTEMVKGNTALTSVSEVRAFPAPVAAHRRLAMGHLPGAYPAVRPVAY